MCASRVTAYEQLASSESNTSSLIIESTEELIIEAGLHGSVCIKKEEEVSRAAVMDFVCRYGLVSLMTALLGVLSCLLGAQQRGWRCHFGSAIPGYISAAWI